MYTKRRMAKREGGKLAIIAVLTDVGQGVGWSQSQGQEKAWFSKLFLFHGEKIRS
jgi:hypothetical protein